MFFSLFQPREKREVYLAVCESINEGMLEEALHALKGFTFDVPDDVIVPVELSGTGSPPHLLAAPIQVALNKKRKRKSPKPEVKRRLRFEQKTRKRIDNFDS